MSGVKETSQAKMAVDHSALIARSPVKAVAENGEAYVSTIFSDPTSVEDANITNDESLSTAAENGSFTDGDVGDNTGDGKDSRRPKSDEKIPVRGVLDIWYQSPERHERIAYQHRRPEDFVSNPFDLNLDETVEHCR